MPRPERSYSPPSRHALSLLGELVRLSRRRRRWTESELAERVGIARSTVQRIERGDPTVAIGLAFEAAAIAGVSLFGADDESAAVDARARAADRLALLPRSMRRPARPFDDDF